MDSLPHQPEHATHGVQPTLHGILRDTPTVTPRPALRRSVRIQSPFGGPGDEKLPPSSGHLDTVTPNAVPPPPHSGVRSASRSRPPCPSTNTPLRRIAFVSNYLPRKCGIANFSHDLCTAITARFGQTSVDQSCMTADNHPADDTAGVVCEVYCVDDRKDEHAYPAEVVHQFNEDSEDAYSHLASLINRSGIDVVCIQHEFGIYGGACGSFLLTFLRQVQVPVVTTLHTILREPSSDQRRVMNAIVNRSAQVVTMTPTGLQLLQETYRVPEERIAVIPHGIPETTFDPQDAHKADLGLEGRTVLLTFGLLSPNKGIEYMLEALKPIVTEFPDVLYVVLGQTHPNLIRNEGEAYRFRLQYIAAELGITDNVLFANEYADLPLLTRYIRACDVYVTPYLHEAQITSGTLAYAFGLGRVVVSTPYWHARDLLAPDGLGKLVDFRSARGLTSAILQLLRNAEDRQLLEQRAYEHARSMIWPRAAERYVETFEHARTVDMSSVKLSQHGSQRADSLPMQRDAAVSLPRLATAVADYATIPHEEINAYVRAPQLPELRLDHLLRLTDSGVGTIQHCKFDVPDRSHGYCTDDCARALQLLALLQSHHPSLWNAELARAASTNAAFLLHAFDDATGRFRNFMSFDRQWIDPEQLPSEDAHGRAVGALGACVRLGLHTNLAAELLQRALAATTTFTSPRAIAFALAGVTQFLERFPSEYHARRTQAALLQVLRDHFSQHASEAEGWMWFEPKLTYNNGALCNAILYVAAQRGDAELMQLGLGCLHWLLKMQTRKADGAFLPVGSDSFSQSNSSQSSSVGGRAFDQQPIEAADMVVVCLKAFEATQDPSWFGHACNVFDWFLGRNHLGVPLFDASTGGCHDGLHRDRVNLNQGAESTICFLEALAMLRAAHQSAELSQRQSELSQP